MKDEQIPEKLMTLEEVAEYLRLSVHTIYKMAQQGKIPALKAGKMWRFRKEEIDGWIEKHRKENFEI
jgi:excisionase family DNA binding protein